MENQVRKYYGAGAEKNFYQYIGGKKLEKPNYYIFIDGISKQSDEKKELISEIEQRIIGLKSVLEFLNS